MEVNNVLVKADDRSYNEFRKGVISLDMLLCSHEERCRIQVYNEYLRKIPQLLQQLEVVETMYEKAVMEESMLPTRESGDRSSELYAERLARTKEQCILRAEDIRQQCHLIFALKNQIENESSALKALME